MTASTASTGADIEAAIAHLRQAGIRIADLAADLGVHRSTAYRWAAGTRTPNADNFQALREWVDARYAHHVHRRRDRQHVAAFEAAFEALRTAEERAESDRLAADCAAFLAQRAQERQAEQAARDAEVARIRDEVLGRRTYRSVTRDIDPFALVAQPEPALPF